MKALITRIAHATLLICAVASICCAATPPPEPEQIDPAQAALQGTWQLVAIDAQGIQAPEDLTAEIKIVIKSRAITVLPARAGILPMGFRIDSTTKPGKFDLIFSVGAEAPKSSPGIFKLEGDVLKVCLGDMERPKDFTTKEDSPNAVFTLQRVANGASRL
jgi:uncharacterized protein (TIGR03067 family)